MRKLSRRPALVHVIAHCRDCDWKDSGFSDAVIKGRNHAERTHHTVSVETGYAQIYNYKG